MPLISFSDGSILPLFGGRPLGLIPPAIPEGVQPAAFGALTPSGAVGAKALNGSGTAELDLTGTPELLSGDATGYTASISGGRLTFTGAAGAPNGCIYRCDLVGGGTVDMQVTVTANARTVGSDAELLAVGANAPTWLDGREILIRPGTYATFGGFGHFTGATNVSVIRPAVASLRPTIQTFFTNVGSPAGPHGFLEFRNIRFHKEQNPLQANFFAPGGGTPVVQLGRAASDIAFIECEFSGDTLPSAMSHGPNPGIGGVTLAQGDYVNIKIERCKFHGLTTALGLGGNNVEVIDNEFYNIYADFINISGDTDGMVIRGNRMYNAMGMGRFLHADLFQFTNPQGPFRNILIEGNVCGYGDFQALQKGNVPFDPNPPAINLGTSASLTVADHAGRPITATAADLTWTLPPAADAAGHTFRFSMGALGLNLVIEAAPGDSHADGGLPRAMTAAEYAGTWGVYSDGVVWRTLPGGFRSGVTFCAVSRAGSVADDKCAVLFSATSAPMTYTMPTRAGMDRVGVELTYDATHPVTITAPGDTIRNMGTGETITELVLDDPKQAWTLVNNAAQNRWDAYPGGNYDMQGVFGNAYDYSGLTVRGNIFYTSGWGFRIEQNDATNIVSEYNTFLSPLAPLVWPDHAAVGSGGVPRASMRGGPDNIMRNCVSSGDMPIEAGTPTFENNVQFLEAPNGSAPNAARLAALSGTVRTDFYPTTFEEAVAMAAPKAGGPLDGTWIGAVPYWDFEAGQKNPAAP